MKKTLFVIAAVIACSVSASGQFYAPADTVYLKSGDKVAVHIKKIENGDPQKGFGYQVFTQESMELVGSDVWAIGIGGYQWVSNKYKEGWWLGHFLKLLDLDSVSVLHVSAKVIDLLDDVLRDS